MAQLRSPSAGAVVAAPKAHRCLWAAALALLLRVQSSYAQKMNGEFGQDVHGCACKGGKATHGQCGYHFHLGSSEDTPWCRTKHGCGMAGMRGSWMYCSDQAVERRAGKDGKLYSSKEFKDFYGKSGKDMWTKSEGYVERRLAKNSKAYTATEFHDFYVDSFGEKGWIDEWTAASPEKRKANDGKWYTWAEFIGFYGLRDAWDKWAAAAPAADKREL